MKNNYISSVIVFLLTFSFSQFCILQDIRAQSYWNEIQSPTTNYLHTLFFLDSLSGWIAGDSGDIFFTTDGGKNWTQQESNTNTKIQDIYFLDEINGWAVSWNEGVQPIGTKILKTTNGGIDWFVNDYPEPNVFLAAIFFFDSLDGWTGGYPGKLLHSTDGGDTWVQADIDSGSFSHFPVINFKFYDSLYALASGGAIDIAGVVWKTTNGGVSWKASGVSPEPIRDLHFLDSLHVLGVGGDPEFFGASIIRTSDGGATWEHRELGFFGVATALSFRTPTECWAPLSFAETMIYSTDSGINWIVLPTPGDSKIYDLDFTDSLTGYGVGFLGKIIKYKKPVITEIQIKQELPNKIELYQNYPNPFNPSTMISWETVTDSWQSLKIYDILGNEVATLVDEYRPAGNYKINFSAEQISDYEMTSGVYYYRLKAGNYSITKKMLFLK